MKITERRPRSDSAKAAIQAVQNKALGAHEPPAYVTIRPQDKPHWQAIMDARPRHTWNESDLVVAAQLARTRADIETIQEKIDAEPDDMLFRQMDVLIKRNVTLTRLIHIHPVATLGRAADSAKTAQLQANVDNEIDELIPTLAMVK